MQPHGDARQPGLANANIAAGGALTGYAGRGTTPSTATNIMTAAADYKRNIYPGAIIETRMRDIKPEDWSRRFET